jgi:phage gp46-like protein
MYNPNNNSLHVCSADGSVVAGWFAMSDGSSHGYYWTVAGGMVDLGANVGPVGLSANGSTTFGSHLVPNGSGGFNTGGFVWTPTGGLVDLGVDAYSPQYCSDDGFIVFGATSYSYWSAHSGQEFFRWTATGGVEFLPLSNVVGCTADGAKLAVSSSVWSEAGVTNLPGLPDVSGDTNITLYGISADGTTVFGTDPTDADNEASIYDVPCIWVDGVVSALPLGSATPGFDRGWQPWYCSANGAVILGASTDNTGALVAGTLSAGCVVVGGNLVILPVPTDSVQIIPQQIAADGKTAVGNSYNGNNFSGVIWRFSFASAAPAVPPPPPAAAVVNQGDIALVWDAANGRADFAMNATGTDLLLDQGLYTAVVVSLFCDRLADAADTIPDGTTDRRGWWGDTPSSEGRAVRAIPNAPDPAAAHGLTGSRLWLLARALQLPETLRQAESYAQEALQWMIDDGVAGSVTASASFPATPPNALELSITIEQDDSSQTFAVALASS